VHILRSFTHSSLAKQSLPDFIRLFWPIVEPTRKLSWNWHLDELCNVLSLVTSGKIKYLIVNVPPGTMKSLCISVFWPAWEWSSDPSLRYLTASYTDKNTIRDNNRVRDLVRSDLYQSHYSLRLAKAGEERMDTTAKGWRIATSVDGQGTGDHPNRLIIDDPLKAKDSLSETRAKINNANNWIDTTVSTRVALDPAIILVMQRLHELDPTYHMESKSGPYDSVSNPLGVYKLCFPMHYRAYEPPTDIDPKGYIPDPRDHRTIPGELLWPEQWSEEKVKKEEEMLGPFASAGQLEQRPIPLGGGLFKRDWFEIVDAVPEKSIRCRGWDIAETEDGGDWPRGVKIARLGGTFYVESVVSARSTLVDALIKSTAEIDGKRCKIREGSGSGKATIKSRSMLLIGYDFDFSPETDSKIERANPFRAQCHAGNVKIVRGLWNEEYLSELCSFPAGKFDDQVDASSNAFNELVKVITGFGLTWGPERAIR